MADDLGPYLQASRVTRLRDWISTASYTPLPDDWVVFVADVEQSTPAILAGRYKEVNALGVACIVAVSNACQEDRIPYTFGGDGAAFVVPPSLQAAVGAALLGLSARSAPALGLNLRVGCVPVKTLRALGSDLRVARRHLSAGFDVALFSGGGLSLADALVKAEPQRYAVPQASRQVPSVQGLECRWNDVPSRKGRILTLVVRARHNDLGQLQGLLQQIEALIPQANPVRRDNLPLSWPPRHLGTELRLKYPQTWLRALSHAGLWALTGLFSRVLRKQAADDKTAAGRYVAALLDNTDHLKLDDVFRAVLDVTEQEARALEASLQALQAAGHLDYGLHTSDHALMTCFVRSMTQHVHFVDGGDGGYAMAARQLKARQPSSS
jgi:hypothetical protein